MNHLCVWPFLLGYPHFSIQFLIGLHNKKLFFKTWKYIYYNKHKYLINFILLKLSTSHLDLNVTFWKEEQRLTIHKRTKDQKKGYVACQRSNNSDIGSHILIFKIVITNTLNRY